MKIKKAVVLGLILGIILVGCNVTNGAGSPVVGTNDQIDNNLTEIAEYFPFLENTILEYEGIGNEYAEQSVFYEFIDGNKAQVKISNPGTNIIKIYELKDGVLTETYMEGEFYHIENMLNANSNKKDIILASPLEVGNSWENIDGYKKEITDIDKKFETPYETFDALEVTTTFDDERFQREYYAKGIGLVGRIYSDNGIEIKTLLRDVKKSGISQDIRLFYPLKDGNGIKYVQDELEFNTNDSVENLIENKMKYPVDERFNPLLAENVEINRVNLDRGEWAVKVDLSDNFIEELNGGSTYESEVIISIVNTLGKFFDTDKVYISLGDRPYESGHLQLLEDETFKVDTTDIEELN